MSTQPDVLSRRLAWAGLWLMSALSALATAVPPVAAAPAAPAEPKTHTLFMGADILVEQDKVFYPVEDVVGGSFLIRVRGKEVKVPADWVKVSLKVDRSLKVTGTAVKIENYKVERAYAPGSDPNQQFMEQLQASGSGPSVGESGARLVLAQTGGNLALGQQKPLQERSPQDNGTLAKEGAARMISSAEANLNAVTGAAHGTYNNSTGLVGSLQDQIIAELYDALYFHFTISADKLMRKPYLVLMAQYRAPDDKPDEVRNWLYATALEPLDATPQKVSVKKGGFPPGYILEKYQVHVYNAGEELATSEAEKAVPLTKTEAFTYLTLDYLSSHKKDTLPAMPVMGKLSKEERGRLDPTQLGQTYYVKVTKDGLPAGAFLDATCTHSVGETVSELIGGVRFYPALEKGRPVEGVAELRLTRISL
jgi:hypothetical protein